MRTFSLKIGSLRIQMPAAFASLVRPVVFAGAMVAVSSGAAHATCNVTVPMLQSIDCGAYPSSLQGFCSKYKPFLMHSGECKDAESDAKSREFGPRKEQCERQSFDNGTGSWSYVWACSWLEDEDPEEEEDDDPECYKRLSDMGLTFTKRGDVKMGYDPVSGAQCTIKNAVRTRGGSISYGSNILAACPLVEALEDYGNTVQSAASHVGGGTVAGLSNLGVFNCRSIRNASGTGSKMSRHATGEAIDIAGFVMSNGTKINVSDWDKGSEANKKFLRAAQKASCSSFRGVLGPEYYKKKYMHFHFEVGGGSFCNQ